MSSSFDEMISTPYGLLLQNQNYALESVNNMFDKNISDIFVKVCGEICYYLTNEVNFVDVSIAKTLVLYDYETVTKVDDNGKANISLKNICIEIPEIKYNMISVTAIEDIITALQSTGSKMVVNKLVNDFKINFKKQVIDTLRVESTKIKGTPLNNFINDSIAKIAKHLNFTDKSDFTNNIVLVVTPGVYSALKETSFSDIDNILIDSWYDKEYCLVTGYNKKPGVCSILGNTGPIKVYAYQSLTLGECLDPNTGHKSVLISNKIRLTVNDDISKIAFAMQM